MTACPHCQQELTRSEIGALYAGLRQTRSGPAPKPRCFCGKYTLTNKQTPKRHQAHGCIIDLPQTPGFQPTVAYPCDPRKPLKTDTA